MEKALVASVCGSLALLALRKALGPATKSFDASGGKTVLVTGGSSGIGLSIALSYARQGARLVLTARSADALESARAAAVAEGAADVVVVAADVATAEGRAAVVAATERCCGEGGALDLVVLNAGISMGETVLELRESGEASRVARRLMEVNYFGSIDVLVPLLPLLTAAEHGVRICAINSVVGLVAPPTRSGYAASKFALKAFLDSLRVELRMAGHHAGAITQVYPGAVATGINARRIGGGKQRALSFDHAMTPDFVAKRVVAAVAAGQRDVYFPVDTKPPGVVKVHALRILNAVCPTVVDGLLWVPQKKAP